MMTAGAETPTQETVPGGGPSARLRILHIEAGRHLYGGAYQVLALLRHLQGKAEHLLLCAKGSEIAERARAESLPVREVKLRGDISPGAFGEVRRAIHEFQPDIVHVHSRRGADVWGVLAASSLGVPLVVTRRYDIPQPGWLARLRYRPALRVIGTSRKICDVLGGEGVPQARLRCIRSGVDVDTYRPGGDRDWLREEFGLATDETVVVMAAQFIPRKGHNTLLAALPEVLRQFPRTRFLLLGRGPLHPDIKAAAAPFGDRVLLPGFRDDFSRILPACDLLVHPAEMEGPGVVLLQAAACGVPAVAGRAGGIPEIVREGETGLLVQPDNPVELSAALCRLLGSRQERQRMGQAARALALRELSVAHTAEANLALYREVMDEAAQLPAERRGGWGQRFYRRIRPAIKAAEPTARRCADFVLPPLGWLLVRTLGVLTWYLTSRRNVALRNLHLAFPDKPAGWHERIARLSTDRMFELFLVPLIAPWLSPGAISRRFKITGPAHEQIAACTGGVALLVPHSTMTETLVLVPALVPELPEYLVLYRPLDFRPADRYVLWARGRWGLKLHSRKEGLIEARNALQRGGAMAALFDQNAQRAGSLILSFGRVCSATDLPGLLAARLHKPVFLIYPRRTGFLRCEISILPFDSGDSAATITTRSAKALEDEMRRNDSVCADWLWAHQRWKLRDDFGQKLNLSQKKSYLPESLALNGLDELPRRTPFCLRLPAEPERAREVVPFLPLLRAARPDVFWVVVAPSAICHELREREHFDRLDPFSSPSRVGHVLGGLRHLWVDTHFCLYPDADPRQERKWCNARKVFAISSKVQQDRRGIALWKAPEELLDPARYPALVAAFLRACGLEELPDCMGGPTDR